MKAYAIPGLETVKEVNRDKIARDIIKIVLDYYGVDKITKRQYEEQTWVKRFCAYFLKTKLYMKAPQIGSYLGLTRTSVINTITKLNECLSIHDKEVLFTQAQLELKINKVLIENNML